MVRTFRFGKVNGSGRAAGKASWEGRSLNVGVGSRDRVTLAFAESAPNAVGLAHRVRVFSALVNNGAGCAHQFCRVFAGCAGASSFAFRVKEE